MATIKLEAYQTAITALTASNLASLANGARVISAAIDNGTNLALYCDVEVDLDYATAPAAGAQIELYFVPSVDGTNYLDGSTTVDPPASCLVGIVDLQAVNTVQRRGLRYVAMPPGLFKVLLKNTGGQALDATGSAVTLRPYNIQSV